MRAVAETPGDVRVFRGHSLSGVLTRMTRVASGTSASPGHENNYFGRRAKAGKESLLCEPGCP